MAIDSSEPVIEFLKILGDKARISILELLKEGEKSPKEIQNFLNRSQSTVSQQLKMLLNGNLISVRSEGVSKFYRVKNTQIYDLLRHIGAYVTDQNTDNPDQLTDYHVRDILH
jgi:DNA-binding transcriptional ArsR family regulator